MKSEFTEKLKNIMRKGGSESNSELRKDIANIYRITKKLKADHTVDIYDAIQIIKSSFAKKLANLGRSNGNPRTDELRTKIFQNSNELQKLKTSIEESMRSVRSRPSSSSSSSSSNQVSSNDPFKI